MSAKRRNRRTAGALLLLGLGLAVWVAMAPAATTVRVTPPFGDPKRVDIAEIPPNVGPDQEYVVNDRPREVTGASLQAVLNRVGLQRGDWEGVQVGPLFFTAAQYERYGDETPPAFFDHQGDARFIVPDRGGSTGRIVRGAPDVAASRYSVRISPDGEEIDAGDSVTFSAQVRGGPTDQVRFSWSGTGLSERTGQSVTYRFPDRGKKTVNVTVRNAGTTVATDSTPVFVDRKPDDGGGGGDGGSSTGTGTGGAGYTDTGDSSDDTTTPSYTPPSYTPPAYDSPGTTPTPESTSPASPGTTPDDSDTAPAPPPTTEVSGALLADASPLAPPAPSDGAAESPEEADDSDLAISGAVAAAGLAVILLGLGAGWEFERIHPRRLLRRPDLSGLRRLLPGRWR